MEYKAFSTNFKGLTEELKNSLWSIALVDAPYRTGNLRSSIKRISEGDNKVTFDYSDQQAYYTDFLERGIGRNKKHIGFIENITVSDMVSEIMGYALTGTTTFMYVPTVQLKTDKARNYERKMIQRMGGNVQQRITAIDRARLSMIRYDKSKKTKLGINSEYEGNRNIVESPFAVNFAENKTKSIFFNNNLGNKKGR